MQEGEGEGGWEARRRGKAREGEGEGGEAGNGTVVGGLPRCAQQRRRPAMP